MKKLKFVPNAAVYILLAITIPVVFMFHQWGYDKGYESAIIRLHEIREEPDRDTIVYLDVRTHNLYSDSTWVHYIVE